MCHAHCSGFFAALRITAIGGCGVLALAITAAAAPLETSPVPVRPRMLLLDGAAVDHDIVVVGERGTILHSSDQAATWQRAVSPTRATLTGVSFAPVPPPRPVRQGWAVGHEAIILASSDVGRTWVSQFQGQNLQESFLDVLAIDEQHAVAVGAYGLYVSTADGGKTWVRRKIRDEDSHLNRISRGPTGTLYLAGEGGTLLRSSDQGATWIPIRAPYTGSFYGIMPLDRRTLLAYGLRGNIFRSVDDGASWQSVAAPNEVLLATGLQLKSNHLLLAGQARTLLISRDYGKEVVAAEQALMTGVAELLELADGRFLALGEAGATVLPQP
jgi:photosystem II stability/assembly factor-like uncharacterized protein